MTYGNTIDGLFYLRAHELLVVRQQLVVEIAVVAVVILGVDVLFVRGTLALFVGEVGVAEDGRESRV